MRKCAVLGRMKTLCCQIEISIIVSKKWMSTRRWMKDNIQSMEGNVMAVRTNTLLCQDNIAF